jgi:hypothetical protein
MELESNSFALYGIREIIDTFPDSPPLYEELLKNTERAVVEESPITFELSRSLIDTTCKTILTDKGIEINRHWESPQLFKETQNQLNYIPPQHPNPRDFQNGINSVINGLRTAIQGFTDLRYTEGIVAHGQDGYREVSFFAYQLQFVARAADTIVHFLYSAHRRSLSRSSAKRIYYEDYPEFNEFTDRYNEGAVVFEQFFPASKILYDSDKDHVAYREKLIQWEIDIEAGIITLDT